MLHMAPGVFYAVYASLRYKKFVTLRTSCYVVLYVVGDHVLLALDAVLRLRSLPFVVRLVK